ncbi:MAG: aminomethyl-transferring glycine dehydrogenase subunit GcvPB, partial [Bdellovibrionota bacterium]
MNYTTKNSVLEENLIFENSRKGARGCNLPELDVPLFEYKKNIHESSLRKNKAQLQEVSEPEVMRHFTRLSTWNYSIDLGIYPLGSCT